MAAVGENIRGCRDKGLGRDAPPPHNGWDHPRVMRRRVVRGGAALMAILNLILEGAHHQPAGHGGFGSCCPPRLCGGAPTRGILADRDGGKPATYNGRHVEMGRGLPGEGAVGRTELKRNTMSVKGSSKRREADRLGLGWSAKYLFFPKSIVEIFGAAFKNASNGCQL